MRLELDIGDLKHFIAEYIKEAYNLETLESNFTYDLKNLTKELLYETNCNCTRKSTDCFSARAKEFA